MPDYKPPAKHYVPLGAILAFAGLIIMAAIPDFQPYTAWASLILVAYGLISCYSRLQTYLEVQAAKPAQEIRVKVQPEGPSFQEVLRAMPDPVMVVSGLEPDDIAGRWVVFANKAAMKLFRMEREGGLLVSYIRNPELLEAVDEALFGNVSRSTLFDETGGAQDRFWQSWTSPLPVEGTGKRLALMVMRDETDVRRIERMRADFLANASHELRTPLASLSGFIDTLRGHAKDDEGARDKFLNIMAAQADRMGRLINDLLSLSRIEMNEHVPPTGEADIPLAVKDVVDSLTILAQEKGVAISVTAPKPGLFPVIGDRDQILQVVQNLTDNALKYAPEGSVVEIEVLLDQALPQVSAPAEGQASRLMLLRPDRQLNDVYTVVRVRDHGPGIRREFLPRLAERFYRVEGQKSGNKLGTGLGLAIVKHIISRHRGGLVVESVASEAQVGAESQKSERVAALPVNEVRTFTAFSAYFPQKSVYGQIPVGPRLLDDDLKHTG
ncbi:ATP-binding protein [Asticcacaulis sp. SL142]|uniref:sensor histidine kinase n=1 Tax=Asticcacaulis sp. SL142 TaxID=2995155 RepID=UPI00226D13FC|nr:histidine kinase dimerization/phospho-acceptor domain-containing protein [Asticcacaulis sp. SL142]WAC47513.1 ATP-binding protein [Asticcacaulis sp. SL142]